MMALALSLGERIGYASACDTLGIPRASFYRWQAGPTAQSSAAVLLRPTPKRALSEDERAAVRAALHSERFVDQAPREVYATLLEEGLYWCHWRTIYRILAQDEEVRERRNQARHRVYARPELMATAPNQTWSWDITKLRGPVKGVWFFLYVIMDIFSRYVVGWLVAEHERETLASELIDAACAKQGIAPGQLTLHADRGSPMVAITVTELLRKLGVTKSHSRPHVCDDNPYSESGFKTMKYNPSFPERFTGTENARDFCGPYFLWYNEEHHHTALALLTPATVHYGRTKEVLTERQKVLDAAYAAHPERYVNGPPTVVAPPDAVWINQPTPAEAGSVGVSHGIEPTAATAGEQPGAEPGSRAETIIASDLARQALDAGEHRAILAAGQAVGDEVTPPLH